MTLCKVSPDVTWEIELSKKGVLKMSLCIVILNEITPFYSKIVFKYANCHQMSQIMYSFFHKSTNLAFQVGLCFLTGR